MRQGEERVEGRENKKSRYHNQTGTDFKRNTNSKKSMKKNVGVDGFEPPTLCL